jgi:hypothetical protein
VIPTLSNNPFEKDVVHKPRDHPPSVSSLNHETLDKLLSQVKTVESSGESPTRKAQRRPLAEIYQEYLTEFLVDELGNWRERLSKPRAR